MNPPNEHSSHIAQAEKAAIAKPLPDLAKAIVLEDEKVKAVFDSTTGALLALTSKKTNWRIQNRPELSLSFRMHAPAPDRRWNPITGTDQKLARHERTPDSRRLTLVWNPIQSPCSGPLDITLTAQVTLANGRLTFCTTIENHSPNVIETVQYPYIGDLTPASKTDTLRHRTLRYGDLPTSTIYPNYANHKGYWGIDHPMQTARSADSPFTLIENDHQGLYVGVDDPAPPYLVEYTYELKPGVQQSIHDRVPTGDSLAGLPVHLEFRTVHFPFVNPGETAKLSPIVLEPYEGSWHAGADIYKSWRKTWHKSAPTPTWTRDIHAWLQIHLNSPEDDYRIPYKDLVKIGEDCAKRGVKALQIVGWNLGGQDRGNPSHDTDPHLGTWQHLRDAIAAIEALGVRVVLFCKFTWFDISSDAYRTKLKHCAAQDPYGDPYLHSGYAYQTPTQLAGINTRRFAITCTCDPAWQDLAAQEFRKVVALGASGMLFDECQHHGPAFYCFAPHHHHHVPAYLYAADRTLAAKFRAISDKENPDYLFAGEGVYDQQLQDYALSYIRIADAHIPAARYIDPQTPLMIAVTGFDDREMINRALLYRYVISYEPFNFKGRLDDFPPTVAYGQLVDAFRHRHRAFLWDAQFRDAQGATVEVAAQRHRLCTVYQQPNGKKAVVIANQNPAAPIEATVKMKDSGPLTCASPEDPETRPTDGKVTVPARSAVVVMQP